MQTLSAVVDQHCLRRDVTDEYRWQLLYAVKRFAKHLGRPPITSDLDSESISRWLWAEQKQNHLSDRSRRNLRASIITVGKAAGIKLDSAEVRQVKVSPRAPEAWSFDELRTVIEATSRLPGFLQNGILRGAYFATVLWFCFETGLRRRDVDAFDVSTLGTDCRAALTQHKLRQIHVVQVTPTTRDDLLWISARLRSSGVAYWRTPLHWPHHWSVFYYWIHRARVAAGIDADVVNRALQHIRRTGATAVEAAEPDSARKYLGHRSGVGLSWASYIDPRKINRTIMPPAVRPNVEARGKERRRSSG